jgi:hypothetical protein
MREVLAQLREFLLNQALTLRPCTCRTPPAPKLQTNLPSTDDTQAANIVSRPLTPSSSFTPQQNSQALPKAVDENTFEPGLPSLDSNIFQQNSAIPVPSSSTAPHFASQQEFDITSFSPQAASSFTSEAFATGFDANTSKSLQTSDVPGVSIANPTTTHATTATDARATSMISSSVVLDSDLYDPIKDLPRHQTTSLPAYKVVRASKRANSQNETFALNLEPTTPK